MMKWPTRLVEWFEREHRAMPWRSNPSPYNVWISEVMLQQTQVATVIPYFDRFIERFPTVEALAAAAVSDVLKCWEGLGYYSRARSLHAAARWIKDRRGGLLPHTSDEWMELPGVGAYTAAAVASIAYGEPVPSIDGNVLRVFTRFWGIESPMRDAGVVNDIRRRLSPVIKRVNPSHFNQAMMEMGALICRPRNPKCEDCVLSGSCFAFRKGCTALLPVVRAKAKIPHYEVAAGIVWRKGKVLIVQRPEKGMLGGLWEFPEGRRRGKESLRRTVARALGVGVGVQVEVEEQCLTFRHAYSHFCVTLSAFRCKWVSGGSAGHKAGVIRWTRVCKLSEYPMSFTGRKLSNWLQQQ
jgi:A/G-specific adenine glycosylase